MFERFTDRARRVIVMAQEESRMLEHDYIGTEHLLLGLLHEETGGVALRALNNCGIQRDQARVEVEKLAGTGNGSQKGHLPFTKRAKKVLELALREALQLSHSYIGTEHILLGLMREGQGTACEAVRNCGADLNQVRRAVVEVLISDRVPLPDDVMPAAARSVADILAEMETHAAAIQLLSNELRQQLSD